MMDRSTFMHRNFNKEGRNHIRKWLNEISYANGDMEYSNLNLTKEDDLKQYLDLAHKQLADIKEYRYENMSFDGDSFVIPDDKEDLRWFAMPMEALDYVQGKNSNVFNSACPFYPKNYLLNPTPSFRIPTQTVRKCSKDQKEFPLTPKVPQKMMKKVIQAIEDFEMIKDGDKILVCLSGGKDSLTLLHALKQLKTVSHKRYEIGAVTFDPQASEYDPSFLKEYLSMLEIPYFYETQPITQILGSKPSKKIEISAFYQVMKREVLYRCAVREGYNVVALGQLLDDFAVKYMMSVFHQGKQKSMKACHFCSVESLKIIRPLVYVRERMIKDFADEKEIPTVKGSSPACFAPPAEIHRTKLLLSAQEQLIPDLYCNILNSIKSLMIDNSNVKLGKRERYNDKYKEINGKKKVQTA